MTGVLVLDKDNRIFMMQPNRRERIPILSGQYLYLSVSKVWVPVLIRYSEQMHRWFFEGMPELNIFHQKVMIKD